MNGAGTDGGTNVGPSGAAGFRLTSWDDRRETRRPHLLQGDVAVPAHE